MAISSLVNLDQTVLSALKHFIVQRPKTLKLNSFRQPLVVGSGNAYNTGLVIFSKQPAIITNESNFKDVLSGYKRSIKKGEIDQVVVISASGEKDSVWEIKLAKKYGLKTHLITCSPNSSAAKLTDKITVYDRLPEPYTYNVSTYLGMMIGASGERADKIINFLKKLKLPHFQDYSAYSFILPDRFASIAPMLEIKRHELFGPHLSLRAFSEGEARHAKFVNVWDKELVISFGPNRYFGSPSSRQEISIPRWADNGFIMALSYYLIGHIQKIKPPYFQRNIERYCLEGPLAYGQKKPFPLIVE